MRGYFLGLVREALELVDPDPRTMLRAIGSAVDEVLGPDGQRVEVGLQRCREVGIGERVAAGDESCNPAGRGPIDGIGRPPCTVYGLAHLRGRPLVSSRPTFSQ